MVLKEIGLQDSTENRILDFPTLLRKRGLILFNFEEDASYTNNKYDMILYEYLKNKPVRRWKKCGYCKRGITIGFDSSRDYYVKDNVKYCLLITYYNRENREVFERVYIQIE